MRNRVWSWGPMSALLAWLGLCGLAEAEREVLELTVDGLQRSVVMHVPESIGSDTPLLVVYHGRGDDAAAFAQSVRVHEDWPEAVVAYPRGEVHSGRPMRGWQYRLGQYDDRDLKLTDRLLAELAERFGARPERSMAAGFSNGGHFVFLLMAERPEAFAAHAVIGSVRPAFAIEAPPRPLLYLFGRGEPRRYRDDWRATVEALVRHQRVAGALVDWQDCCKVQGPVEGGAPLVFGTYNAGHIWPARGNHWLKAFYAGVRAAR